MNKLKRKLINKTYNIVRILNYFINYKIISLCFFKKGQLKIEKEFFNNLFNFYKYYNKLNILNIKKNFLFKIFTLLKINLNKLNKKLLKNSKFFFYLKS